MRVHYMLRLNRWLLPLSGNLLASLTPHLPQSSCGNPMQCGAVMASGVAGGLADRGLAGFHPGRILPCGATAPPISHRPPWLDGQRGGLPRRRQGPHHIAAGQDPHRTPLTIQHKQSLGGAVVQQLGRRGQWG